MVRHIFFQLLFLGHNQPCDLPDQDGLVIVSKDGTEVLSDNLGAPLDRRHKMPSCNNTAVNVFFNVHDLSQIQRGTGNNNSTIGNFLHRVLFKVS